MYWTDESLHDVFGVWDLRVHRRRVKFLNSKMSHFGLQESAACLCSPSVDRPNEGQFSSASCHFLPLRSQSSCYALLLE